MILHVSNPVLVLIRGLPGSGKTHIANRLQQVIANDTVMLDPDAIDFTTVAYTAHAAALSAEGVDEKLHPYRFLRGQAYQGIADGKIIIWNQPFTNLEILQKMVANLRSQAAVHQTRLSILIVEVTVDRSVAWKRIEERKLSGGHGPSEDTFERFIGDYRSYANEGFETVQVNGSDDVDKSVATIMDALQALVAEG